MYLALHKIYKVLQIVSEFPLLKIFSTGERALRFPYNDHNSSYEELLGRSENAQCM